jgi:hypothetical protein
MEIRANIRSAQKAGRPLELLEDDVKALHKILQTLREERQMLNGRRIAATLLLSLEENQEHLLLLQRFPGIPGSLRESLIQRFTNGEYYGKSE